MNRIGITTAMFLMLSLAGVVEGAPTDHAFTFQGFVEHDGSPYSGSANFEFRLFDEASDETQQGSTITQLLDVEDGRFSTELDFGVQHYVEAEERFLQIAIDISGGTEFETLDPRQRIAPTPVALMSLRPWETIEDDIYFDGSRVGIGTTSPLFRLDVRSPTPRAIFGQVTSPVGATYGIYGQSDSNGGTGVAGIATANEGSTNGLYGQASSDNGKGVMGFATDNNGVNYGVYGQTNSSNGWAGYFDGRGQFTDDLGVRVIPAAPLHVLKPDGDSRPTAIFETLQGSGTVLFPTRIEIELNSIDAYFLQGTSSLRLNGNHAGPVLMGMGGGKVGIGEPVPLGHLHVQEDNLGVDYSMLAQGSDPDLIEAIIEGKDAYLELFSNGGGAGGSGITLGEVVDGSLVDKWSIHRRTNPTSSLQFKYGANPAPGDNDWIMILRPDGTTRVKVLEIDGADLAEKFPSSEATKPGMVMAIDPANPGNLHLARGAYNRMVAGVVSGANDFSVGAVLGNLPGHEDAPAIALTGRVYVYCDASHDPIRPGDLLTTSPTPGHAMKVTDHDRAQGAVIGKAMTELNEGTGLVLVLITLQ